MRRAPVVIALLAAGACKKDGDAAPSTFDATTALAIRFIGHVGAARFDEAHALLCPEVAAAQPADGFRRAVAANPFLRAGTTFDSHTSYTIHGATELEGALTSPAGIVRASFYVSRIGVTNDGWCLTGALIGGTAMLPAYGTGAAGVPAEHP